MENTILDTEYFNAQKPKKYGTIITLGVFLFLSISGFIYFTDEFIRDFLAWLEIAPSINFWARESLAILFTCISLFLFIRYEKKKKIIKFHLKKTLTTLIIIFAFSQLIQFTYAFFQFEIWPEEFTIKFRDYLDWEKKAHYNHLAQAIFEYSRYIIFIIFLKRLDFSNE